MNINVRPPNKEEAVIFSAGYLTGSITRPYAEKAVRGVASAAVGAYNWIFGNKSSRGKGKKKKAA